jgi:hypothetical protein
MPARTKDKICLIVGEDRVDKLRKKSDSFQLSQSEMVRHMIDKYLENAVQDILLARQKEIEERLLS